MPGRSACSDAPDLPDRPVRVAGRIRCRDPLQTGDGERLVAFHRDVEVLAGGRWRSVERLRETRSFELWDHDGSLTVDPAAAAEPLDRRSRRSGAGDPALLEEPHASAVARLAERHGPATEARDRSRAPSTSPIGSSSSRAPSHGDDGSRPAGAARRAAIVITNLALDDAMRLLGGREADGRRASGVVGLGVGAARSSSSAAIGALAVGRLLG